MPHKSLSDDSDSVHDLFVQAMQLSPADQVEWLSRQTEGKPDVRRRVLRLLKADKLNQQSGFLSIGLEQTSEWLNGRLLRSGYIGRYKVVRVIGSGGMAQFWKCWRRERRGRLAAIQNPSRKLS